MNDDGSKVKIQVPIVRVFGPILRSCGEPIQNGCVHIHNAFPYIICRPAFAGMDDSYSYYESISPLDNDGDGVNRNGNNLGVDWNCIKSVESVLDVIERQLEKAFESFEAAGKVKSGTNTIDGDSKVNLEDRRGGEANVNKFKIKYIRDITVVKGRGFYGYCTGAACPFIKIRYYNPAHRWKVKAMVESGALSGIEFRCFEAHIPYTMQLLKDWRVAGFEYINFDHVLFRSPLPKSQIRDINNNSRSFCESNVSAEYYWGNTSSKIEEIRSVAHERLCHGLTPTEVDEVDFILSQNSGR